MDIACGRLLAKVDDEKRSIELFLANGGAKSWDDYCRAVGSYSSLLKIESDINDVEKSIIED